MISYCQHEWEDATHALRDVFVLDPDRDSQRHVACRRCLRIRTEPVRETRRQQLRILARAA